VKKAVKKTILQGIHFLLASAAVITTTVAIATSNGINPRRHAHALIVEEAGRLDGAESVGLFSMYRYARVKLLGGSTAQLGPMMFGPDLENPFFEQGPLSLLARMEVTGFPVLQLRDTSRFKNKVLLEICRIVNQESEIEAAAGSPDDEANKKACEENKTIWGHSSEFLWLDVLKPTIHATADGSKYSSNNIIVAIHDIISRIRRGKQERTSASTPRALQPPNS
jgi:hypothetical protein